MRLLDLLADDRWFFDNTRLLGRNHVVVRSFPFRLRMRMSEERPFGAIARQFSYCMGSLFVSKHTPSEETAVDHIGFGPVEREISEGLYW